MFDTFIAPSSTDKEEDTDPEDLGIVSFSLSLSLSRLLSCYYVLQHQLIVESVCSVDFPIISSKCVHEIDTATAPLYSGNYPISVKQFYANFFSEKADPFWRDFHARDGYAGKSLSLIRSFLSFSFIRECVCALCACYLLTAAESTTAEFLTSPWTLSAAGCCHERQVHFRTLTGMSFGPKSTRVAQHQRCRFVDNQYVHKHVRSTNSCPAATRVYVQLLPTTFAPL